jgi:hypothetical protein
MEMLSLLLSAAIVWFWLDSLSALEVARDGGRQASHVASRLACCIEQFVIGFQASEFKRP